MAHYITWEDDAGALQWLSFDRLDVEEHDAPTDVTEYPVEEGSDINDNVRPGVKRLRLEGYMSNKPLLRNLFTSLETHKANFLPQTLQYEKTSLAGNKPTAFTLPPKADPFLLGPGALSAVVFKALDSQPNPFIAQIANQLKTPAFATARTLQQTTFTDRVKATQNKLNDIWKNSRLLYVVTSLETYTDMVVEHRVSSKRKADGTGASFVVELKKVVFVSSELVPAPNASFKVPLGSRAAVAVDVNSTSYQDKLAALAALRPDSYGALVLASQ